MRKSIESLIVDIGPAGEASSSRIGYRSVAIKDILVVLIPFRDFVVCK